MKKIAISGIPAALGAALLFGAGTPAAKVLVGSIDPWMLAGILYLGSGIGLALLRVATRRRGISIARTELPWLVAAIALGGVVGPVLLMWGLARIPASSASLLLNAEAVAPALIAWFVLHENFDRRIASGMLLIVAGAIVLSWPESPAFDALLPSLAVIGACLASGRGQQPRPEGGACRRDVDRHDEGVGRGNCQRRPRIRRRRDMACDGSSRGGSGPRFLQLQPEPGPVRASVASPGNSPDRSLFLHRPVRRRHAIGAAARRTSDMGAGTRGVAHGAGRLASPHRASRPCALAFRGRS